VHYLNFTFLDGFTTDKKAKWTRSEAEHMLLCRLTWYDLPKQEQIFSIVDKSKIWKWKDAPATPPTPTNSVKYNHMYVSEGMGKPLYCNGRELVTKNQKYGFFRCFPPLYCNGRESVTNVPIFAFVTTFQKKFFSISTEGDFCDQITGGTVNNIVNNTIVYLFITITGGNRSQTFSPYQLLITGIFQSSHKRFFEGFCDQITEGTVKAHFLAKNSYFSDFCDQITEGIVKQVLTGAGGINGQ